MFCLLGKMNQFVYINFLCIAWIYRYYFNLITCDAWRLSFSSVSRGFTRIIYFYVPVYLKIRGDTSDTWRLIFLLRITRIYTDYFLYNCISYKYVQIRMIRGGWFFSCVSQAFTRIIFYIPVFKNMWRYEWYVEVKK